MWPRKKDAEPTEWRSRSDRPRVLIEHHDAAISVAMGNLLAAEGYEVAECSGPDGKGVGCPLVGVGVCARAAEADVVVYGLGISDESNRDVLRALKEHFQGTPVVVEVPQGRIPQYKDELAGCVVVPQPVTRDVLLNAVERALR